MEDRKVSVLIPAYNEEKYIRETIKSILEIPEVDEILVVDDASKDKTSEIAKETGVKVITLENNSGKGGALNVGIKHITGDIVALVDGDLGATAGEVRKLILPIINNQADMTIARFPKARKKGGFGLVKGLARNGIKLYTGLEMYSPLSGQRVMTKEVVKSIGQFASGYGVEVGLTIDVARKGFKVIEVEAIMTHAETGRDLRGFLHRGKQFIHVFKELAKRIV